MCIELEIQKEMIYEFCRNDLTPTNDDVSVTSKIKIQKEFAISFIITKNTLYDFC